MNSAHLETTSHQNARLGPVEPDVKSSKARELFNAGVSGKSKIGKSTDPTCYDAPVEPKQESKMLKDTGHETIEVVRDGRTLIGATDLVYSPDDGGYYFSQADFQKSRARVSSLYRNEAVARSAWAKNAVRWEPWS